MARPGVRRPPCSARCIASNCPRVGAHIVLAATLLTSPVAATALPPSPTGIRPHHPVSRPDTVLRVTFLDVGQGDAILLQAPEGRTALVDAGSGSDIVPLLRDLGVERIDLMVATHPHADHIGGMRGVIESIPVRFFMDNGDPHATTTYRSLIAALEARPEITYLEATPRTISRGSATLEVLPLLPRGTAEHNDRSIALLLRFGDFTALLSGDSEVKQLTHLTGLGVVPALTLLKAPHHGSDNGFTWGFLRAARPRVVVISVGRDNGFSADVNRATLRDLQDRVCRWGRIANRSATPCSAPCRSRRCRTGRRSAGRPDSPRPDGPALWAEHSKSVS